MYIVHYYIMHSLHVRLLKIHSLSTFQFNLNYELFPLWTFESYSNFIKDCWFNTSEPNRDHQVVDSQYKEDLMWTIFTFRNINSEETHRQRMVKFRSVLIVVVAILVSFSSSKHNQDIHLRRKRADSRFSKNILNQLTRSD